MLALLAFGVLSSSSRRQACEHHARSEWADASVRRVGVQTGVTEGQCCAACGADRACDGYNWHPLGNAGQPTYCFLLAGTATNGTLAPTHANFSAGSVTSRPPVCANEEDCSLAGACVDGRCICDGWTHGDRCEVLNLLPVDADAVGYRNASGFNTWGGASIEGGDGKHYLFLSQIGGRCPLLGHWAVVSEGVRLVGATPNGPWSEPEVILPSFAHNVKPFRAPDGTWLLFYIGGVNNRTENCTGQPDDAFAAASLPLPAGHRSSSTPWGKTTAGPIMLASASRPDAARGEWTVHGPLTDSVEWHSATNPSAVLFPNGSVLLAVSRAWAPSPKPGGGKRTTLMRANSWRGPYTNITHGYNDSIGNGEDPDLFRTPRGFHMLNHNTGPASTKMWFSKDGVTNWKTAVGGRDAFNATVLYTNGTEVTVCQRQRPQVVMGTDGMPGWLWTGVMTGLANGSCPAGEVAMGNPSWTLAQKIGRTTTPQPYTI